MKLWSRSLRRRRRLRAFLGRLISPASREQFVPLERSSPRWNATFLNNRLYINADGAELAGEISRVEIWEAFQESLLSSPESGA